jgi:guanine deaminase
MDLYRGTVVYSKDRDNLAVHENSYIAVEEGIVVGIYPVLPEEFAGLPVTDFGDNIVIPAFSDLHVHAPQYPQRGLQMDKKLYEWLNDYTFPLEAKYADPEFARAVYDAFAADLILNGTLHAVIFGTIHREATGYLIRKLETLGLNAFVGKVNMDTASPEYLCESTEESLRETELFLEEHLGNHFAKPILTPRFAPTCTKELMTGLGKLGAKYGVGVQTHLVPSEREPFQAASCIYVLGSRCDDHVVCAAVVADI